MASEVAIVTGVSSGIGLGIAQALLERGFAVVGVSRNASRKAPLEPSAELVLLDGDVGDPSTAVRALEAAVSRFGRADLLVNNAGIFIAKPFTEYGDDDLARLVSTNIAGFFHMTRSALRQMVAQGAGHVVTISSALVAQPLAELSGALSILTKGGLEAATKALAIEYAARGIRVNAVAAGMIDTPMNPPSKHAFLRTLQPMGRLGSVQEVADAVLYLQGAAFVSGEIVHVDGGAHAGKW